MNQTIDQIDNTNFCQLISLLKQNNAFLLAIDQANQKYLIKKYKINDLNPSKITMLYGNLQKKFYHRRAKSIQESWYENELRIFVWLLAGYLYINDKIIKNLAQNDWQYFSSIFNFREYTFFQYQSIELLPHLNKAPKWSNEQSELLQLIIQEKNYQRKWNSIARQLFVRSNKMYYRNPKQCREHWMNHLDPVKLHTSWTTDEDTILMLTVKKNGKKWSAVVKKLGNTRTQHMVKNRYKSLISNYSKKYPSIKEEDAQNYILNNLLDSNGSMNIEENQKIKIEIAQSKKEISRKNSNQSNKFQQSSDSQELLQLSESDFLNSPLPIPYWDYKDEDIKNDIISFRQEER